MGDLPTKTTRFIGSAVLAPMLVLMCARLVACTNADAPGTVTGGGNLFDAAAMQPPTTDAGADAGAGPATFSSMYADFFGPTGAYTCTYSPGNCHGGPSEDGTQSSGGFICGADASTCYTTMVDTAKLADCTQLYSLCADLRHYAPTDPTMTMILGDMPLDPSSAVFPPAAYNRILTWIDAGAPNN